MGIFEPYRALGYITDDTPFAVQKRGLETFITVSVGKAFQIYNCSRLSLLFVGPQLEKKIRALACWQDFTFVASGTCIYVYRRAHQLTKWCAHGSRVIQLLCISNCVLSLDADGWLFVWGDTNLSTEGEPALPMQKLHVGQDASPSSIMHPDTYLNKVLVGSEDGSLYLWNFSTGRMLYKFAGWGCPVRCCASSPALDVVGIGCADGKIYVHNLRFDETIITLSNTTRDSVTALSFRTDGRSILAAGASSGIISLWNLEKHRLQSVIKDAHECSVASLHFLANEPVLVSSGGDNSIKIWIFDSNDGEARLLRFRSGHNAPPSFIRFYGSGRHILSAGRDRAFRVFSTIQDQQSKELSQGHVARRAKKLKMKEEEVKLPPVVSFAAADIRERDWCNVVTCHMDEPVAYSWRLQNFVIGEHILKPTLENSGTVKACALSSCGNFALIGTDEGIIERFNIQSGLTRQCYSDAGLKNPSTHAHDGAVIGIACDATNTFFISGGYDSYVKVWNFKEGNLKTSWMVGSPIMRMEFHRGSGLVVVASDDLAVRVYDVIAARLARIFKGHTDRITDLCFSEDGKWILSSSMDGSIRVWDVIASRQIDAMLVNDCVTSLSLSPSMDMLATTHVGHNGIYMWANRTMYSGILDSEIYGSGKVVVRTALPTMSSMEKRGLEDNFDPKSETLEQVTAEMHQEEVETCNSDNQILPQLITLSLLPKAQWQSLVNLDIIKVRNKPMQPPKIPDKAPFFLPSLTSLSGEINFNDHRTSKYPEAVVNAQQPKLSEITKKSRLGESMFSVLLLSCSESGDFRPFLVYLKSLTPSEIDLEFRMLKLVAEDSAFNIGASKQMKEIGLLLDFFVDQTRTNQEFEFLEALIRLFLKIHGDTILEQSSLHEKAKKLLEIESARWQRLDCMFQNVRCCLSFLSNSLY